MRLWMLILLCFIAFMPVPIGIWLDAFEKQASRDCADGLCELRLSDWSVSETVMPVPQQKPLNQAEQIKQGNAKGRQ